MLIFKHFSKCTPENKWVPHFQISKYATGFGPYFVCSDFKSLINIPSVKDCMCAVQLTAVGNPATGNANLVVWFGGGSCSLGVF